MVEIKNHKFPLERDLYGVNNTKLISCLFDGVEDGESALKETENIALENCCFKLRYPIWHSLNVKMIDSTMTNSCRAALWYCNNVEIEKSKLHGIKAVRECENVCINNSDIYSSEFGWKCKNVKLSNTVIKTEYAFFDSKKITLVDCEFGGKYSFQYVDGIEILNSKLDTKDAFWHSKNVVVKNSIVKGEYLGWYSKGLTLINCKIIGTQPLCYCEDLTLIDCEMIDTDLSFEYSSVNAKINGNIKSVKNPKRGKIVADSIEEIILTEDSKYACECQITCLEKLRG